MRAEVTPIVRDIESTLLVKLTTLTLVGPAVGGLIVDLGGQ